MDRGALIGGGAVLAALAGVGVFYFVLSSGDTGEVGAYERESVAVEALGEAGGDAPVVRSGAKGDVPVADHMGDAMRAVKRHKPDPEGADHWRQVRQEARVRDQQLAGRQLDDYFGQAHVPAEQQKDLWNLFNDNFELRKSIQEQVEAGELSPHEGRKLLAEQRSHMKGAVIERVGEEGFENIRVRMEKVRVVVF